MIHCIAGLTRDYEIVVGVFASHSKLLAHAWFGRDFQDHDFMDTFCASCETWGEVKSTQDWAIEVLRELHEEDIENAKHNYARND
jgi:hypothetical protein